MARPATPSRRSRASPSPARGGSSRDGRARRRPCSAWRHCPARPGSGGSCTSGRPWTRRGGRRGADRAHIGAVPRRRGRVPRPGAAAAGADAARPQGQRAAPTRDRALDRGDGALGDALHNLLDSVVLGVAFRVGPELGVPAALAVVAHEVPQEVGDLAILLGAGLPRGRAFALDLASASTVIAGAAAGWGGSGAAIGALPWLLPIAAGGFACIALADLVPALHRRRSRAAAVLDLLLLGIATVTGLGGHG